MADETEVQEEEGQMSFFDHLAELRDRLIASLKPVIPMFILAWIYREETFSVLAIPLNQAWKTMGLGTPKLHFASPVDHVVVYMKLSAFMALLGSSPWIFYQAWSFIAPGLYAREKKIILPFVFASTICFTIGGLFGWFVIFPPTFEALLEFAGKLPGGVVEIEPMLMMDAYVTFIAQMLLVFGVTFEVPVVIVFLSMIGLITSKQLMKFGRWWLVVASILSAILTPTQDALSMLLLLVPLVGLYYLSVVVVYLIDLKREREQRALETSSS